MTDKNPSRETHSGIWAKKVATILITILIATAALAGPAAASQPSVATPNTVSPSFSSTTSASLTTASTETASGGVIYTASDNSNVSAIDAETGEKLWNYTNHSNKVYSLSVSPDEKRIYTASTDDTVRALNATNGSEVWVYNNASSDMMGVAVGPDGSSVYSSGADNTVRKHNVSTGEVVWNYTGHTNKVRYVTTSSTGDVVYTASYDNTVRAIYANGTEKWSFTGHTGQVRAVAESPGGDVLVSVSDDDTVRAIDTETGSQIWKYTGHSNDVRGVGIDNDGKRVYTGSLDQTIRAISLEDGTESWKTDLGDQVYVDGISEYITGNILIGDASGNVHKYSATDGDKVESFGVHSDITRVETPAFWSGLDTISGTVRTQHGNPCPNCTVVAYGVAETALDPDSAKSLEEQANDLIKESTSTLPDSWDRNYDLESHYQEANGNYLLVHEADDFGFQARGVQQLSESADKPTVQVDSDQQVVLSVWDPSQEGSGIGSYLGGNQIDNTFPGQTVSDTIVLEQKGPTGDTIDRQTLETETIGTVGGVGTKKDIPGIKTSLPPGAYVAYPEGARERGYTFIVGSPTELASSWETELKNKADKLSDRAKRIRGLLDNNEVVQATNQTTENGSFTIDMPSNVVTADVKALKADGELLQDAANPSLEDLRKFQTQGYNGTFYLPSPQPKTVNPPAENVSVTVYRSPEVPMGNIETFADLQQWLRNQQLNETISELQSEYDKRFSEMNRSVLERTYKSHKSLIETVPGSKDRYLKRSTFDSIQDAGDLSDGELATETNHMQVALAKAGEIHPSDPGENPITIEDGQLHAEYPLPEGINQDTLQPEIHWSNGESEQIADKYWSIESTLTGPDTLVIDGYPIDSSDPAAFDLRILGGGENGVLDDRISGLNPAFDGTIPDVRAIDLNTLAPGEGETVSMTFRTSEDSSFQRVDSLEVFGPDGKQLSSTIVGDDEARFETKRAGQHFVRATITDTTGATFVQTFSVRALEQGRNDPPTVRAETAVGDRLFAVVGDGLDDARIQRTENGLEVDAIVPGGEIPGSIHVKPQAAVEADETSIDVQVLEGNDEATVSSNVATVIHLDSLSSDARVWRGEPAWLGEPLSWDGGTRYGEVMQRGGEDSDKVVIRTYTNSNGQTSITIDTRDGLSGQWASAKHGFASTVPRPNIPFVGGMAVPAAGGTTVAGVIALFGRRRSLW